MPTVFVPGVAASTLRGLIGSNPWACTFHWQNGSSVAPWTAADINLLAQMTMTAWNGSMKGNHATNVSVVGADAIDLTNSTGAGSTYTAAAIVGTLSGVLEPASAAVVVQCKISARYRGGHPRVYWPAGTQVQMLNEYQWTATFASSMATAMVNYVSNVRTAAWSFGTSSLNHVIPRYTYTYTDVPGKHKYLKTRNALLGVSVVNSYVGNQKIGSQRRRLSP